VEVLATALDAIQNAGGAAADVSLVVKRASILSSAFGCRDCSQALPDFIVHLGVEFAEDVFQKMWYQQLAPNAQRITGLIYFT
jgi:hypothetical protein